MFYLKNVYKLLFVSFIIVAAIFFASCSKDDNPTTPSDNWTSLKIAVISDPHFYDASLGTSGDAFNAYLAQDPKLLAESYAIIDASVTAILAEKPDIVLVPGDLTKDGEQLSHQTFASFLKKFTDKGIKVIVVPGNHDIYNPESYSYSGASHSKVANITDSNFVSIYSNCGFSTAISRDPNSLSYLSEPRSGLWVLAIDACIYSKDNVTTNTVAGQLSDATMSWIKARLQDAKTKNKTVIGMMHHGIIEHFAGEATLFADYLVNNYQSIATQLAQAGLRVMFTGHFHANDIVEKTVSSDFIFDIETGSTVQYPCPYRIITLSNTGKMDIKTNKITQIDYDLKGAADFQTYAKTFLKDRMGPIVDYMLKYQFGASDAQITMVSPLVVSGLMAHYAGDETPDATTNGIIQQLMTSSDATAQMLGNALYGLWNDQPPKDNNITIDLKTGAVTQ
jgi:UDP-2,3-diacylglucosamine pyrophosphatase LpxH